MFRFTDKVKCWWPVKVKVPSETTPGTFEEEEFEIEFILQDRNEAEKKRQTRAAMIIALNAALTERDLERAEHAQSELEAHDVADFKSTISNWRGIEGDNGPFLFSDENMDLLINRQAVRVAISDAYREAIGEDKARLGN